jgi:predicted GIY-YIG superfamily endonuclease
MSAELAPGISRPPRREDCPTSLYRHFAADGVLLYVGVSLSWPARTKAHAKGSRWFEQVSRVEIERFYNRDDALAAEREVIKRERPKFNVIHNCPSMAAASPTQRRAPPPRRGDNPFEIELLRKIVGPHAIIGPALVYRAEIISVMVAHGTFGTPGELIDVELGMRSPEAPEWADACASVLILQRPGEITLSQARELRGRIIGALRKHLGDVQAYDTDLALATAYATQFPSEKSRQVLDDVAKEVRR